jgi:Flp pilus assembly protein TadG
MPVQPVRRLREIIRNSGRDSAGVAGIEFAIIAPVLAIFILGLIDLGLGFEAQMSVSQAAQAGSYYALLKGYDTAAIASAIQNASNSTGISGSSSQSCGCPSSGAGVANAACGSSCPNGQTAGTYVSVSAQYQYSTVLPYPGLTSPMTLSATSMVRIK